MSTQNPYAKWFGYVVWLGIAVNLLFIIPTCFFPEWLLSLLRMTIPIPIIWVRAAGLLLLEISILYIPGALDPYRYRATAWMSVLVTRGGGASFFLIAVLFFGSRTGFSVYCHCGSDFWGHRGHFAVFGDARQSGSCKPILF